MTKVPAQANFLQTARICAETAYAGKRLKFEPGRYMRHAEAVAGRVRSTAAKAVALLHDVIEIKVKNTIAAGKDLPVATPQASVEELLIQRELRKVEEFFASRGHDFKPLTPHLDTLTHRTDVPYRHYIRGLAHHARATNSTIVVEVKGADLEENRDPERNRRGSLKTDADLARLDKYDWSLSFLREEFPDAMARVGRGMAVHKDETQRRKSHAHRPQPRRLGKQQRLNLAAE